MAGKPGKLIKSKSQELLDLPSSSNGLASKMKKVFQSSPTPKKKPRAQSLNNASKVFGVPLKQLLDQPAQSESRKISLPAKHFSASNGPHAIPPVVVKIVNHIEKHGLDQEGLYRINGNSKLVEKLRIRFDNDGDVDLTDVEIYSIGSLLKLFLRQLPDPLVPDPVVDCVVKLQETITGSYTPVEIKKVKDILTALPKDHYRLLKYLCAHLSLVAEHTGSNKMTAVSLSIVFGPNIFRCGDQLSDIKRQGYANSAFAQMILHYRIIFDEKVHVHEENNLRAISESSDDVFLPSDSRKKKKPELPQPYHVHKNAKTNLTFSLSCPSSPNHETSLDSDIHVYETVARVPLNDTNNDESVSPHERSIDEAIEEAENHEEKTRKRAQSESIAVASKSKSLSDDILISRVPSPLSWNSKSSMGTSPPTSPNVTPRTSQAYNTLIGDSIQDHLFQSPETSSPPPPLLVTTNALIPPSSSEDTTTTTTSSNSADMLYKAIPTSSEGTTDTAVSSESVVQMREEPGFTRRKKSVRNRKSAVFSSDRDPDNTIQLVTVKGKEEEGVDTEEKEKETTFDNGKTTVEGSFNIKSIRDSFEKKGLLYQFGAAPARHSKDDDHVSVKEEAKEKPPPPKVPEKPKIGRQALGSYTAHDFDYVTRQIKTLDIHPTKQRARGPKRAKPSRQSSSFLVSEDAVNDSYTNKISSMDVIEEINLPPPSSSLSNEPTSTANYSVPAMSDVTPVSSHVAPAIGSISGILSPAKETLSISQSTIPVADQPYSTVAVSTPPSQTTVFASNMTTSQHVTASTATVTVVMPLSHTYTSASNNLSMPLLLTGSTNVISHTTELSSSHTAAVVSTSPVSGIAPVNVHKKPIVQNGEKIEPKEKVTPLLIPAGWTSDSSQIESLNYDELIIEARRLRDILKSHEREFLKKHQRKPRNDEYDQVTKEKALLTAIKQRIRTLRSNQVPLNKTSLPTVQENYSEQFISQSSTRLDDFDESKVATSLRRKETVSKPVRRHQSLVVGSSHGAITQENPLCLIMQSITASLEEKRRKAGRTNDLKSMTPDELMQEKHLVQKTLLQFEKRHGRPQSPESKAIMRPLYDTYREIKRLVQKNQHHEVVDSPTIAGKRDNSLWSDTMLQQTLSPDLKLPETPHQQHSFFAGRGKERLTSTPISKSHKSLNRKSASTSCVPLTEHDKKVWMSNDQLQKASAHELRVQLELAQTRKREQRQQLRAFETEFQEREKRPVQHDDKRKLMHNEYIQYKELKNRISQLEQFLIK
ncbi:PREDICTED: rho GTPase-activating protein 32-like isoform X2 [Amphimedon queenslandica]|uniref:Rho-GAP domain-containing protein n=1 Tax=Amphimedon queenslandica TaxID=400682 RepID=A0AAN0J319_AMPQE|nr:PREDICTED: rho GTPase-activating protein 32-like isoform X2 [Amphimedon queenslandica]|eukprot:XP_019851400.1 PREDICTED: rho GTPase-activating protein 32-like isoform X2 [Amphimedon queenslandica]